MPSFSFRVANEVGNEILSSQSSYRECAPASVYKIHSDISSLKASQAGEKESFISNNDFKDEIWQRLELVSASYSFLTLEHLKTQGDEEKKEKKKGKLNTKEKSPSEEQITGASSREPNKIFKDENEIPFVCNMCNGDCLIF